MPGHVQLKIGDRTFVLVPSTNIEQWTDDCARWRLRGIAQDWPEREPLLRASGDTLGPDDDVGAAIEHLVHEIDCGYLLAVRLPDPFAATGGARSDGRWDAPRLADLGGDRGDRGRRIDVRGAAVPRPGGAVAPTPTTPLPPGASSAADRPTDTWTTFVAFVVVDQNGKPLRGSSRCTINGTPHTHALGDAPIEIDPVAAHARVELELDALAKTEAPA